MKFVSTRGSKKRYSFVEAALAGLADDGGLLMPEHIPTVNAEMQNNCLPFPALCAEFLALFVDQAESCGSPEELRSSLHTITTRSFSAFNHPDIVTIKQLKPCSCADLDGSEIARKFRRLRSLHLQPSGMPQCEENHNWNGGEIHPCLLELFHGPTFAFKDIAMQFLGELLFFLLGKQPQTPASGLIVLVATSGDTGSAAIAAFKRRSPLIHVVILFPKGRTSEVQRLQMVTSQDPNIYCLEVKGTFDDCQRMVKSMLSDKTLQEQLSGNNQQLNIHDYSRRYEGPFPHSGQPSRCGTQNNTRSNASAVTMDGFPSFRRGWKLSVVNSINCVRILIQAAYWWYSALKMQHEFNSGPGDVFELHGTETTTKRPCNIVVPTGNFGNIFSAFLAKQMGAPIGKLLLATNSNDVLGRVQETGVYDKRRGVRATCSPSMDIAAASNFERLLFSTCMIQGKLPQRGQTNAQATRDLIHKQGGSARESSSLPGEAQKVPDHCQTGDADTPEDKRVLSSSPPGVPIPGISHDTCVEQSHRSQQWCSTVRDVTERFDQEGYAQLSEEFLSFYRNHFSTEAVDDAETRKAIEKMYRLYGEIVDPHTAVGYAAYLKHVSKLPGEIQGSSAWSTSDGGQKDVQPRSNDPWLLASTAHFGKFPETILSVVGQDKFDIIPEELRNLKDMPQRCTAIDPSPESLRRFIVEKFLSRDRSKPPPHQTSECLA
uniref:Threonine synthase, putative n=1 Tax=Neospora caninum (strain Liverpool) TaxID=572307 RepID=A0A0F7U7G9_NEOCL|nr:TPA: threonine synthase, putative [Neospora caninum Liverpool]